MVSVFYAWQQQVTSIEGLDEASNRFHASTKTRLLKLLTLARPLLSDFRMKAVWEKLSEKISPLRFLITVIKLRQERPSNWSTRSHDERITRSQDIIQASNELQKLLLGTPAEKLVLWQFIPNHLAEPLADYVFRQPDVWPPETMPMSAADALHQTLSPIGTINSALGELANMAETWSEGEKYCGAHLERRIFLDELTKFMRSECGKPLNGLVGDVASLYFDTTNVDSTAIKRATQRRKVKAPAKINFVKSKNLR